MRTPKLLGCTLVNTRLLYTPRGILLQRWATFEIANRHLYAILHLAADKAAAVLVTIHACDTRGTRGDALKVMSDLKHLKVPYETIRALQVALVA